MLGLSLKGPVTDRAGKACAKRRGPKWVLNRTVTVPLSPSSPLRGRFCRGHEELVWEPQLWSRPWGLASSTYALAGQPAGPSAPVAPSPHQLRPHCPAAGSPLCRRGEASFRSSVGVSPIPPQDAGGRDAGCVLHPVQSVSNGGGWREPFMMETLSRKCVIQSKIRTRNFTALCFNDTAYSETLPL